MSRVSRYTWIAVALLAATSASLSQDDKSLEYAVQQYEQERAAQRWDRALAHAQRAVELLRPAMPSSATQLVDALCRVGFTHYLLNDYASAERSYAEALETAEANFTSGDQRLVAPMRGLARSWFAQKRYEESARMLERALLVNQRNEGLDSPAQLELLRMLADSQTHAGDFTAAERTMLQYVQAHERKHGRHDARAVAAHSELAEWYVYVGELSRARTLLRQEIANAQAHLGEDSPALIRPLRALARSYVAELMYGERIVGQLSAREDKLPRQVIQSSQGRFVPWAWLGDYRASPLEGERALLRALEIAQSDPAQPPEEVDRILLDVGDWYQLRRRQDAALRYYKQLLARQSAVQTGIAAVLSYPAKLFLPLLASRETDGEETGPTSIRYAVVEFDVTASGSTDDVRVIEGNATEREKKTLVAAMRAAQYRPKFANGEPLRTPGMRYRHVFK